MFLEARFFKSRATTLLISTALLLVVGYIDYATGREWHVTPLYLLPLGLAAWGGGIAWGIVYSTLIAIVWLLAAELANGSEYSHPALPYWNALMFYVLFLSVALLLARLRQIMDSLDQRVKAKTAQLREEMTRRHQAELAHLGTQRLAAIGSMAAQMAHEVRNPMCSISLNMELLSYELEMVAAASSQHSPAEAHHLMHQMETELRRINLVIKDYLGFARPPKSMPQPQMLHAFLDEKLALIRAELSSATVTLLKDYDSSLQSVSFDPVQIWQVLLNLIRNAREAMPGGGSVTVRTRREAGKVQIFICDTGCGIARENIDRLFTPFFTTKEEGTGLGLALSQQIVAEHGGQLHCQSTPGSGTSFIISLPLPASPPEPARAPNEFKFSHQPALLP